MTQALTLSDIAASGVGVQAHEAVAIAQQLIDAPAPEHPLRPPLGPPTLENVRISRDGSVVCSSSAATPAVFEIGILLEAMPPRTGAARRVPGGLRYTIARALLEVDAPPFDSISDLSAALARFESGDRRAVVRELYARAKPAAPLAAMIFPGDRRRSGPSTTELRRQLREADERLYSYESARGAATQRARRPEKKRRSMFLAASAAAAVLAVGDGDTAPPEGATSRRIAADSAAAAAAAPPALEARSIGGAAGALAPATQASISRNPGRPVALPAQRLVRAVATSAGPTFSPSFASNGTALFFHTGRSSDPHSALEAAPLDGAAELHVMTIVDDGARNFHVQPSPDGTRVAFDSDRDGERGVYIAARDGTGVRRVSGPGYAAVPTWSPDGRQMAFVRAEPDRPRVWNLWLLTLETGEMRRLTGFRFGQTWSGSWFPDGRHIAYTHEDRLAVLDLDGGPTRQYRSPIKGRLMRTPAVSPAGHHVIFQVAGDGAWLLDLRDGAMRPVLSDPSAEEFAWSPDGRRVAFHSRRDGQWGIWFMASS
jgi:Tol biopolymer transport system component